MQALARHEQDAKRPTEQARSLSVRTTSPLVASTFSMAAKAARMDIGVLIRGETGVGKDVLARAIHGASARSSAPFRAINCASLTASLIEAELFGHERGSFTGAHCEQMGLLESSNGGTVFLDEIAEAPLALQASLLRALESREIYRIGGRVPRKLDVRFIAATNRDVAAEMAAGRFRTDLFYRLSAMELVLPPLRERIDDLPLLCNEILIQLCAEGNRKRVTLTDRALDVLRSYSWPGNIRELKNILLRALSMIETGEVIDGGDLTLPCATILSCPRDERAAILSALNCHGWNQVRTAKALGISRTTLVYRLNEYKIPRPQKYG